MDKLTKAQRSENMRRIKNSGSKIEVTFAKSIWHKGYRYRKNDKSVFGKPDFTFKRIKLAVFIDSEFWHGKDWETKKHDIKSNRGFWIKKIERNIERDKEVNEHLFKNGWKVLRFWGKDIQKNIDFCVNEFESAYHEAKQLQPDK